MDYVENFSTNGVVKRVDIPAILTKMEACLKSCATETERDSLKEKIYIFVTSRKYFELLQDMVEISPSLDRSVGRRISGFIRDRWEEASRMSMIFLGRSVEAIKLAITQSSVSTVLTYSIFVQSPEFTEKVANEAAMAGLRMTGTQENIMSIENQYNYLDLMKSSQFQSIPDVWALEESMVRSPRTVHVTRSKPTAARNVGKAVEIEKTYTDLKTDLESKLQLIDKNEYSSIEAFKTKPARSSVGLRSIGEIQSIIINNDYKFMRCFENTKYSEKGLHGKMAVRFAITPEGKTYSVEVLRNSFDKKLESRIAIQLYQVRFSKLLNSNKIQTVYHTFFF